MKNGFKCLWLLFLPLALALLVSGCPQPVLEDQPVSGNGSMQSPGDTDPGDPGNDTDPTEPGDPSDGNDTQPTEPGDPGNDNGTEPTEPGDPGNGNDTDPTEPGDPGNGGGTDPTEPGDPSDGNDTQPTEPGKPGNGNDASPENIQRHNWMKHLPDNTFLGNITIPGTHNSGSEEMRVQLFGPVWIPDITDIARTQEHPIYTQLNHGIRFLDIRLALEGNTLFVVHRVANAFYAGTRLRFEQVLEWSHQFLLDNPSETIVMSLRNDRGNADMSAVFRNYITTLNTGRYSQLFLRTANVPTLGEARGRIVLFRRSPGFNNFTEFGVNWAAVGANGRTTFNSGGASFVVDDRFEEQNTVTKAHYVTENMRNAAASTQANSFHVTFASIAGEIGRPPRHFAWDANPAMNNVLTDFLRENTTGRFGAVLMNFYDNNGQNEDPLMSLIRSNF